MSDSLTTQPSQPSPTPAPKPPSPPETSSEAAGFGTASGFATLQRGAQCLAASTLVPATFRNSVSNCVIALELAQRLGASPLMVMQNLYVVHGKPGWSAQFLVASFNQSGRFSAIRYEWSGQEGSDQWGCRAWAVEKGSNQRLDGAWITIALSKAEGWFNKDGSKWRTMPQQMLMYRAATFMVRAYAPEIAMGLQTVEELHDALPEPYSAITNGPSMFTEPPILRMAASEELAPPAEEPEELTAKKKAALSKLAKVGQQKPAAPYKSDERVAIERDFWEKWNAYPTKQRLEAMNKVGVRDVTSDLSHLSDDQLMALLNEAYVQT